MSLRFSYVLCKSTGEPVGEAVALGRTFSKRLNTPATAKVILKLDDPLSAYANPNNAPRLKIYRAATAAELAANPAAVRALVFYGSLPPESVIEDAGAGTVEATFQDPRWILNYRYLSAPAVFAATDQAAIVYSLVTAQNSRTGGDTFMTSTGVNVTPTRDRTYDAGKNIAEIINELTQIDGGPDVDCITFDGWSNGATRQMGQLIVYAREGSDRPNAVFAYGAPSPDGTTGGLPTNVVSVKRTRGPVTTQATMTGTAIDGTSLSQTYGNPAGSGYGLAEWYETQQDVSQTTTLLEKAVGKVTTNQDPQRIYEITTPLPTAPLPLAEYDVGDTIRLNVRRGSFVASNVSLRVHGMDMTISQNGEITEMNLITA